MIRQRHGRRLWLWVVATLLGQAAMAQTVSGTVTDAATGETLIGVTVLDKLSGKGTVTNAYGRYTLTLKDAKTAEMRFSYVGYKVDEEHIDMEGNPVIDVRMEPSVELDEVTVTADRVTSPRASQMSAIEVPVEHIKMVPVLFGEADVLKALQLLPGVQSGSEGTSGIYVRGGGPDENLFLLDGVPLYNVNHLGGFFSAFNSDAIKNVTLYKGSFPAHFAGRISSVVDITTNDGNENELHGGLSVGVLAAKLNLEGPLFNKNTTFSISARRTYGDILIMPTLALISLSGQGVNFGYHFYDVNAKVSHKFSNRSRLYASFYMGDDVLKVGFSLNDGLFGGFSFKEEMNVGLNWGNMTAALRWNYVINPKLFMNITGSFTRYRNDLGMGIVMEERWNSQFSKTEMEMTYNSGIADATMRADFDYSPSPDHNIRYGGAFTFHRFIPEVIGNRYSYHDIDTTENEENVVGSHGILTAGEMMLYGEDDFSITEAFKLNAGMAVTGFIVEGKTYFDPQPRLSGRFMLTDDLSVKAGYSYMAQYLHLLSTTNISLPTDLWVPVTARIAPMRSHQVAAGVAYSWRSIIDFSVEGYYKWMNNLMEYRNGSNFWGGSASWEDKVCLGRGWAYGIEFLAQKTVGDITGWVGYTWSRTFRLFDREGQELNNGIAFPAKYDRIHDISIMMMYKPSKRIDVSVAWVFATGNTTTLALQEIPSDGYDPDHTYTDYEDVDDIFADFFGYSQSYKYVESRNNYRMPAYHRMDVSLNLHKTLRRGTRTISISVYNLYNRQNPFSLYRSYKDTTTINGRTYPGTLMQLSLFPILPSISYIWKF